MSGALQLGILFQILFEPPCPRFLDLSEGQGTRVGRVVRQPSLPMFPMWMAEAAASLQEGCWEVRGAGLMARVTDRVADQTVMKDSRKPADLGWEELGKESLCGGCADIDDSDDSCCVLSRTHNRFFVVLLSFPLTL